MQADIEAAVEAKPGRREQSRRTQMDIDRALAQAEDISRDQLKSSKVQVWTDGPGQAASLWSEAGRDATALAGPALDQIGAGFGGPELGALSGLRLAFSRFNRASAPAKAWARGRARTRPRSVSAERQHNVNAKRGSAPWTRASVRDTEQQRINLYRDGTDSVDEGKYERAIRISIT